MATKVKAGTGFEWKLSMRDEKGFLLGIHFDRDRKISKVQMDILKAALLDAAEKLDDLADSKRNRSCAKNTRPADGPLSLPGLKAGVSRGGSDET